MSTDSKKSTPSPAAQLQKLVSSYAKTQTEAAAKAGQVRGEVNILRDSHAPGLRRLLERLKKGREKLVAFVDENRDFFGSPRTHTVNGVKVGLKAGTPSLEVADAAKTVAKIRQHFPERAAVLINEKPSLVASAVKQLEPKELRKIGVKLIPATDSIVITTPGSEVDKLISTVAKEINSGKATE